VVIGGPLSAISWRHAADMRVCWYNAGDGLLTAVAMESDGTLYRLVVERLPNGAGWDWSVWRPGEPPGSSQYGDTPDKAAAIAAAERQACNWTAAARQVGMVELPDHDRCR
jgi:hypothetical protein